MKTKLFALVAVSALVLSACKSFNPATGQPEYDPVKTAQVKAAVVVPVTSAIRRVILNSPAHSDELAAYFRSVGTVFCKMRDTGNFSPEYLVDEVNKVVSPSIGDNVYADIKNAAVAIYKISYAQRANAELPPDKWPYSVADVLCSGIDTGLRDAGKPGVR